MQVVVSEQYEVPWREWLGGAVAPTLDAEASDMAAIQMVLRSLHRNCNTRAAPISVTGLPRCVNIIENIKQGQLQLVPCVPKSSKIFRTSTHPDRVAVHVHENVVSAAVTCVEEQGWFYRAEERT